MQSGGTSQVFLAFGIRDHTSVMPNLRFVTVIYLRPGFAIVDSHFDFRSWCEDIVRCFPNIRMF